MSKFKPFHEFQKPLIGFTPESFLDYAETAIPPRTSMQISRGGRIFIRYRIHRSEVFLLGQHTYHPKLLLSLLFYGYATRSAQH